MISVSGCSQQCHCVSGTTHPAQTGKEHIPGNSLFGWIETVGAPGHVKILAGKPGPQIYEAHQLEEKVFLSVCLGFHNATFPITALLYVSRGSKQDTVSGTSTQLALLCCYALLHYCSGQTWNCQVPLLTPSGPSFPSQGRQLCSQPLTLVAPKADIPSTGLILI